MAHALLAQAGMGTRMADPGEGFQSFRCLVVEFGQFDRRPPSGGRAHTMSIVPANASGPFIVQSLETCFHARDYRSSL